MSATKPSAPSSQKKDYTTEIPMFDLEEVIRFVTKIHDLGLEAAPMPEIAKRCGYTTPTSTPFYRRMVASRHFGLLSKSGADLTVRIKDYLKPDSEGADRKALVDAILGVPRYAEIVQKHDGKKLNEELVANGFSKVLSLTDSCAKICAKAFISSLKFASLLTPDMTVSAGIAAIEKSAMAAPKEREGKSVEHEERTSGDSNDVQTHTLYLDKTKTKKFTVTAPLAVTALEIKRIQKWIEVTLLIDSEEPEQEGST